MSASVRSPVKGPEVFSTGSRGSTSHNPPGNSVEKWMRKRAPSGPTPPMAAGDRGRRVHDKRVAGLQVLRQIGNVVCVTSMSPFDTRSRTSPRPMPRDSGGSWASSAGSSGMASAEAIEHGGHDTTSETRVRPLGSIGLDQCDETGDNRGRQRAIRDVFAGERVLVHLGAHVARIDDQHAQLRMLGREHRRDLLERGLRRSVAAPRFVGLDRRVGGDVHDRAMRGDERGQQLLRQRERRDDVDFVNVRREHRGRWRRAPGSGLPPNVLALLTSRSSRPSPSTAATNWSRCVASAMSPAIATTAVVAASSAGGAAEPVGAAGVDDECPPEIGESSASANPSPCDAPVISATRWFMARPPLSFGDDTTKNK